MWSEIKLAAFLQTAMQPLVTELTALAAVDATHAEGEETLVPLLWFYDPEVRRGGAGWPLLRPCSRPSKAVRSIVREIQKIVMGA